MGRPEPNPPQSLPVGDVWRAVGAIALALIPAGLCVDGLVTGSTLAFARRADTYTGAVGVVTAIAYGLFAAAMVLVAAGFLSAKRKRRAAWFKWAGYVAVAGACLFFSARLLWVVL